MIDSTLDQLIERYEMGRAYKAITDAMGPSPQLIAFVNYDKMEDGRFALESFDIKDQHIKILNDIESDPSISMALEQLFETICSDLEIDSSVGMEGLLEALSKLKLFSKGIDTDDLSSKDSPGDVSNTNKKLTAKVVPFKLVAELQDLHDRAIPVATKVERGIPHGYSVNDWRRYENLSSQIIPPIAQFKKEIDSLHPKLKETMEFDQSGWTKPRYDAALKKLEMDHIFVKKLGTEAAKRTQEILDWKKTNENSTAKDVREIIRITGLGGIYVLAIATVWNTVFDRQKALSSVAKYFK